MREVAGSYEVLLSAAYDLRKVQGRDSEEETVH
jgi:hypothetical protein